MMCSQWLPSKMHVIWTSPVLKLVLAQSANPRFKSWMEWKYFPLWNKHQEVDGMTDVEVVSPVFFRGRLLMICSISRVVEILQPFAKPTVLLDYSLEVR
jgi:hypothetical protein